MQKRYAGLREPSNIAYLADTLKKETARSSRVTQDRNAKFEGKRRFENSADSRITWTRSSLPFLFLIRRSTGFFLIAESAESLIQTDNKKDDEPSRGGR